MVVKTGLSTATRHAGRSSRSGASAMLDVLTYRNVLLPVVGIPGFVFTENLKMHLIANQPRCGLR